MDLTYDDVNAGYTYDSDDNIHGCRAARCARVHRGCLSPYPCKCVVAHVATWLSTLSNVGMRISRSRMLAHFPIESSNLYIATDETVAPHLSWIPSQLVSMAIAQAVGSLCMRRLHIFRRAECQCHVSTRKISTHLVGSM